MSLITSHMEKIQILVIWEILRQYLKALPIINMISKLSCKFKRLEQLITSVTRVNYVSLRALNQWSTQKESSNTALIWSTCRVAMGMWINEELVGVKWYQKGLGGAAWEEQQCDQAVTKAANMSAKIGGLVNALHNMTSA